ncbi:Flagellar MotB protein [Oleispira antarctica RB-8]|uniref:Flagellar MotB protein n=1 Tax=Oleispira antarctica RB-8 TaxID=698738 RepID=R4YRE9_OLEAN|nr:Flagellar MotB protein [Oleispira antarctica RB-8]
MTESVSNKHRGLRRRRPNFEDSSSSWLITYSDAVTLLLAFFVMILSVSDLNQGKVEALKEGLTEAMTGEAPPTPFTDIKNGLEQLIEQDGLQDQVSVTLDKEGVKIEFSNVSLYQSGSADIKIDAIKTLNKVTQVILKTSHKTHMVEVGGHTDNVPIHTEKFPSNWELSSARATNVVKYLLAEGIEKERLKAAGYADSRPKENSLNLPLNQQREDNRRVVIFVKRY